MAWTIGWRNRDPVLRDGSSRALHDERAHHGAKNGVLLQGDSRRERGVFFSFFFGASAMSASR
jgi:hypothetical protein